MAQTVQFAGPGIQQNADSSAATFIPRTCRSGELGVTEVHGRYQEATARGNVYSGCGQAVVTFGTALTATMVTLALINPANSGKNLVILKTRATVVTGSTAGSVVYAVNSVPGQAAVTFGTKLTAQNALIGSGNQAVGIVASACTLPAAPVAIGSFFTIPVTAAAGQMTLIDEIAGEWILTPNTAFTIQGITSVGTGILSITWEEVIP